MDVEIEDDYIPTDADKMLFAEDLVTYVMNEVFFRPYEGYMATDLRQFVLNAFTENVKVVLKDFICRLQVSNSPYYSMIAAIREPNENRYWKEVRDLQDRYSPRGFDARLFLMYCVDVTITAIIFKDNGFESAPDTAVLAIHDFLKEYDMIATGWSSLNVFTSHFASMRSDEVYVLTPPDSISPQSSESEHQQDLSNSPSMPEKDSVLQSKEDYKFDEDLNWMQTNMPVSKDAYTVDTKLCTENLEFSCSSKWKDLLLPSGIQGVARGEIVSAQENEAIHSKDDLFVTEGIEVDNLQTSSVSAEHKTLKSNTSEGDPKKSGTTTESDLDNTGTYISNEKMDTVVTCHKSLAFQEDKEHLLDNFNEHDKLELSEESCMLLIPKKNMVSHVLSQLPGPSSESK